MYESEIKSIVASDKSMGKRFCGVYGNDNLPSTLDKLHLNCGFIINEQSVLKSGSHWCLAYFNASGKEVLWFDPFAKSAKYYSNKIQKWLEKSGAKIVTNDKKIQCNESVFCGLFCLYYLYWLSRGYSARQINKHFSRYDCSKNDKIVSYFFKKKFNFSITRK